MRLFENNDDPTALIDSAAGEDCFCQYCDLSEICGKAGMPKILPLNMKVLRYAYLKSDGKERSFPYNGNWEHQPKYLLELIDIATVEIHKQRKLKEGDNVDN